MNLPVRILLSLLAATIVVLIPLDFGKENYLQTLIVWVFPLAVGLLIPISLYSSVTTDVQTDDQGVAIPRFHRSTKWREQLGAGIVVVSIATFIGFLIISLLLDVEEAYEFAESYESITVGPVLFLFPVGLYLLITKQCSYCRVLNIPKQLYCKSCSNKLEKHVLDSYAQMDP